MPCLSQGPQPGLLSPPSTHGAATALSPRDTSSFPIPHMPGLPTAPLPATCSSSQLEESLEQGWREGLGSFLSSSWGGLVMEGMSSYPTLNIVSARIIRLGLKEWLAQFPLRPCQYPQACPLPAQLTARAEAQDPCPTQAVCPVCPLGVQHGQCPWWDFLSGGGQTDATQDREESHLLKVPWHSLDPADSTRLPASGHSQVLTAPAGIGGQHRAGREAQLGGGGGWRGSR